MAIKEFYHRVRKAIVRRFVPEIADLRIETDRRLAELESGTDKRLEEFKTEFAGRLAHLESGTDKRLGELKTELAALLAQLESGTDKRMGELKTEFAGRLEHLESGTDKRLEEFKTELDGRLEHLGSATDKRLTDFKAELAGLKTETDRHLAELEIGTSKHLADFRTEATKRLDDLSAEMNGRLAELMRTDPALLNTIDAMRKCLLRNEASLRSENAPGTLDSDAKAVTAGDYSIGYSCNLLNNAYIFCKIARSRNRKAFLFLDPNFADLAVTAHPRWEEISYTAPSMPASLKELPAWRDPDFVREAHWSLDEYSGISQKYEFDAMQKALEKTGIEVCNPYDYMLAYSVLPHRQLLELYNTVDLLQVSGTHIGLASFARTPYVTFPYGADLVVTPFDDSEIGWMQARGFRKASRHIVSGEIMSEHMRQLGIPKRKIDMIPFMIDTNVYAPNRENPLAATLHERYPGKVIFFLGARQNWVWKGNDKLFRGIAKAVKKTKDAIFLMVWYGQDLAKSQSLIKELEIEGCLFNVGVLSKGAIREHVTAVDVCVDQFTHGGLGTFSLESMSCGTPLITHYSADKHFQFKEEPPLLNAFTADEICEMILHCVNNKKDLRQLGLQHRRWILEYHGADKLWPVYDEAYRKALTETAYMK